MISFEFGELYFEGSLALGTMNPGICINEDLALDVFNACLEHFQQLPFAYIAIRTASYSVDPLVYNTLSRLQNFMAMAVVVTSEIGLSSTTVEQEFIQKPFKAFTSLLEAKKWALEVLQ